MDFYALFLNKDKISHFNTSNRKINFIKKYSYNQYQISDLVKKCELLNNRITAFLPDVKEKFYNDYNYLKMDKYLIESENIKAPQQKLKFWNDLLFKYENDLNELNNINIINSLEILGASELRYKNGSILSANFKTLCQNEIEKIKNNSTQMQANSSFKSKFYNSVDDFSFFQIYVIEDLEFEGEIYKDVKQKNNNSILTPENWEQHKDTFFKQRMEKYKSSFTQEFKIKKELEYLKN